MNKSETIAALSAAMVKAQAEMHGAKKSSDNPFFKSRYADLSSVMQASKQALSNHGLAIVQMPITEDGKVGVESVLLHESGEWISQTTMLAASKQDPQSYGSAITYARRYAWQAVCGIPSEDDDGNYATHGSQRQSAPAQPAPSKSAIVPQPLLDTAWAAFESVRDSMTTEQVNWAMDNLNGNNADGWQAVIDGVAKIKAKQEVK